MWNFLNPYSPIQLVLYLVRGQVHGKGFGNKAGVSFSESHHGVTATKPSGVEPSSLSLWNLMTVKVLKILVKTEDCQKDKYNMRTLFATLPNYQWTLYI